MSRRLRVFLSLLSDFRLVDVFSLPMPLDGPANLKVFLVRWLGGGGALNPKLGPRCACDRGTERSRGFSTWGLDT